MNQVIMATTDMLPTAITATGTGPAAALAPVQAQSSAAKDRFSRRAGPDVSFKGPDGPTDAYAVFQIDPESKRLRVTVVDGNGQVLRVIPPRSVSEMMESMGRYRL
jgi:hypothetical protein